MPEPLGDSLDQIKWQRPLLFWSTVRALSTVLSDFSLFATIALVILWHFLFKINNKLTGNRKLLNYLWHCRICLFGRACEVGDGSESNETIPFGRIKRNYCQRTRSITWRNQLRIVLLLGYGQLPLVGKAESCLCSGLPSLLNWSKMKFTMLYWDRWIWVQPGLQSESQDSQHYTERP